MSQHFSSLDGSAIVNDLVTVIVANREYLSEVDGAIGDGDHGINMAKGFAHCGRAIAGRQLDLAGALDELTLSLMEGIGGSMGPLYGSLFIGMADEVRGSQQIDAARFARLLRGGLSSLQDITDAGVGDKCLMDTLIPAVEAFEQAETGGASFKEALQRMKSAASQGRDSTRDLVAKIGRASRLGERSLGVLDAGAVSCCLILTQLADSIETRLV
ncbi:dihydroxyacetone kinase subunit DhaL [Pseudomonas chlororaphis]|uniref:Dihydroxyacetone kinase subunit DhaL n=1 Tax=Pseudomonas chlororaphis TaxID=587753 RepID=A0AAX3FQ79_9PSED|nr:dihydroxyacetone kinase subunit DhaL [Pseudomonas chlororaphis]AZC38366.1 Putative dihydroxyacetone kinase, ADP-binding subunit [Pseudomonas chlororaphis subsp. piscium]AZC44915.1 Putative dihydroxyacetone kinase, ADP-binding subunit [Pseudomonas chlororaphis subsp. piscium]WDG70512.1 dihydroxyacetone kinase subunit DhaL [Pseudomonas chlororaphis]WDH31701.1 dihydroxyacetone kinase subunit DhaL [Pseudomonas chlororaphis]WDH69038.1 dihydroxyacetone kinase subunit DhaL [Pseudomonas chlororaphi